MLSKTFNWLLASLTSHRDMDRSGPVWVFACTVQTSCTIRQQRQLRIYQEIKSTSLFVYNLYRLLRIWLGVMSNRIKGVFSIRYRPQSWILDEPAIFRIKAVRELNQDQDVGTRLSARTCRAIYISRHGRYFNSVPQPQARQESCCFRSPVALVPT